MHWSDQQQAMLREMGLRLWAPLAVPTGAPIAEVPVPAVLEASAKAAPVVAAAPLSTLMIPAPPMASAEPSPVASMDWPALRDAVAGCRACSLCESRRHTVFGVGHPRAHCMVVGEAPGEQEDQRGEPFVGAAGQLLDRMLAALGLTRDEAPPARQVFIANTLKCRPPRNRNPSAEELATCQPFLERQVALVQPRVILAMGAFAVRSLLGSDAPIGRLRGQVHHWHGVPLVVTYHPAYLLRQPADKARAWDDLCLAASCLAAGNLPPPAPAGA
jgi:DNA polymerase